MSAQAEPRVTVAIPTHRRPRWFAEALASARALDWTNLEILVCDDGGLAETGMVVQAASDDPRIVYVRGDAEGLAVNHRRALDGATGRYIAFLADDDRIHPAFLRHRVPVLEADASVLVAFGGYRICNEALEPLRDSPPIEGGPRALDAADLLDVALSNRWSINSSLYRASALPAIWPALAAGNGFDLALHLRLSLRPGARGYAGEWRDIDYRLHTTQASRGEGELAHFAAVTAAYVSVLEEVRDPAARQRIARDLGNWRVQWARAHARQGSLAEARRMLRRLVLEVPTLRHAWSQLAVSYLAPERMRR